MDVLKQFANPLLFSPHMATGGKPTTVNHPRRKGPGRKCVKAYLLVGDAGDKLAKKFAAGTATKKNY